MALVERQDGDPLMTPWIFGNSSVVYNGYSTPTKLGNSHFLSSNGIAFLGMGMVTNRNQPVAENRSVATVNQLAGGYHF